MIPEDRPTGDWTNTASYYKESTSAVLVFLVVPLVVAGLHLFDHSVQIIGYDVRTHILKIDILYDALLQGYWPDWIPSIPAPFLCCCSC